MKLKFELNGDEITIGDPTDSDSWLSALAPFIKNFADDNYGLAYEQIGYTLNENRLKALANSVGMALEQYRLEVSKSLANGEDFTEWKHVLGNALTEAMGVDEAIDDTNDQALYGSDFDTLYENIEEAMSDYDGPVADLDDLIDEIRSAASEKMQELDWTTIYDAVGEIDIPLLFVPGFNPANGNLSDFDISADEIQYCKHLGYGEQALLSLLRVSVPDFMEYRNFDHKNTALIDAWIDGIKDPTVDEATRAHGPMFKNLNMLDDFFADGGRDVLPCWIGSLTPNRLKTIDPLKDNILSGGLISLNDYVNGSGSVEFLHEKFVVLSGDWMLSSEHRYSVEQIFDITARSMRAEIKSVETPAVAKTIEIHEFAM